VHRKVAWISIQLALADGARTNTEKSEEQEAKPKRMSNEEMKAYFNNRNKRKK